jgi:hypothetical protein
MRLVGERARAQLVVAFPAPSAAPLAMHGTAPDSQSGMLGGRAGVVWALSPAASKAAAEPAAGGDFTTGTPTWHCRVSVRTHPCVGDGRGGHHDGGVGDGPGDGDQFVRAGDDGGAARWTSGSTWAALLAFAQRRIRVTTNPPAATTPAPRDGAARRRGHALDGQLVAARGGTNG